jgi:hypothetical protein
LWAGVLRGYCGEFFEAEYCGAGILWGYFEAGYCGAGIMCRYCGGTSMRGTVGRGYCGVLWGYFDTGYCVGTSRRGTVGVLRDGVLWGGDTVGGTVGRGTLRRGFSGAGILLVGRTVGRRYCGAVSIYRARAPTVFRQSKFHKNPI